MHTMRERFENAALFLPSGLPFKLIRHKNGTSRKRFGKPKEFENDFKNPFRFRVDETNFENGALGKR